MSKFIYLIILLLFFLSNFNNVSAFTYSGWKYINDKTKISIDNAIKNLDDSKLKTIQGKIDKLLWKKLSKKNSEMINYLSYSIKTKLIISKKIESEKQKQALVTIIKPIEKTNTWIINNTTQNTNNSNNITTSTITTTTETPVNNTVNNSQNTNTNTTINSSTIWKYPSIKTVEELKKYVKEYNDWNTFTPDLDQYIYKSLWTWWYWRIDDPNNIDWTKWWDRVSHQDLSENALWHIWWNTYFYTLWWYTKEFMKWWLSDEDYTNTKKELENLVASLIEWKSTDEEKIKVIFDWVSQNIKYWYNSVWDTPILVYKNKKWICSGYSQLLYFMLKKAGIKNVEYVIWTSNWVPHAWLKIGEYYYDPTNWVYKFTNLLIQNTVKLIIEYILPDRD